MSEAIEKARRSVSAPFIVLCCLLVCAFAVGGSSRSDISSLMLLRPAAVFALAFGLWGLRWEMVRDNRFLMIVAATLMFLPLMQLIPLPPALWSSLPGRDVVADIDRETSLGAIWRPISLTPTATWNALFSLFVPLAVLVLGVRLAPEERMRLLPVLIVGVLVSALLGLVQVIGPRGSPLYFYQVTHGDSAVGLFANRNHQAAVLACLFPMMAIYASVSDYRSEGSRWRGWAALGISLFLIPLILITGSRLGMFAGLLGAGLAVLLFKGSGRRLRGKVRREFVYAGIGAAALAMGMLTVLLGRAESLTRVLAFDATQDARFSNWSSIAEIAAKYMPLGSGYGSFADVFKIYEPRAALHSSYFNQAHNDWLEVAMTGGVLAVALLAAVAIAVVWRALSLGRKMRGSAVEDRLAGLGIAIILIFAFGSTTDYPLRVPSIACMFVIAALWAAPHRRVELPPQNVGVEVRLRHG